MYLKSLTLKGFKSFAKPTTFQFESGVTAIVGPNGSGKSNVVDALAWVMGEQSVKTLRGGKMDDVIFAGTSELEPLGRAEVTLTIDNTDGALPIDYREVTIRRTLFRQGSSEYSINGENCRLREVQDLLSDSGLGREMHVIVGQGRLDAVLRASPEERRGFIEEAAGILKHRRRKERTVRKLDSMEGNLNRLNDLLSELRRQLTPLGKQAELARSAQKIAAEARDARARLLADDVLRLREQMDVISATEHSQRVERAERERIISDRFARQQQLDESLSSDELIEAQQLTAALESAQAQLRNVASQAEQRITLLGAQNEDTSHVPQTVYTEVEAAIHAHRSILDELASMLAAKGEREHAVSAAQEVLLAAESHNANQRKEYAAYEMRQQSLRSEQLSASRLLQQRVESMQLRASELEGVEQRAAAAEEVLKAAAAAEEPAQPVSAALDPTAVHEAAVLAVSDAEAAVEDAKQDLRLSEHEHVSVVARQAALRLAAESRDASDALLGDDVAGVLGRVSDHISVRAGFEAAVAAALGALAEGVFVADAPTAKEIIAHVQRLDLGRVTLLTGAANGNSVENGLAAATDVPGAVSLATVTTAPQPVMALLSRAYYVAESDRVDRATAWLEAHESSDTWVVVSSDGCVYSRHTFSGGSQTAPSRIEVRAELESAELAIAELEQRVTEKTLRVKQHVAAANEAKVVVKQAFIDLRAHEAEVTRVEQARHRLVVRAESIRGEADRVSAAVVELKTEVVRAEQDLAAATAQLSACLADPISAPDESPRAAANEAYELARAEELTVRVALEALRERERAAQDNVTKLQLRWDQEQLALAQAQRRSELRAEQLVRAERVRDLVPILLRVCDASLNAARESQRTVFKQQRTIREELRELRERAVSDQNELSAFSERLHETQLLGNRLGMQHEGLVAQAAQMGFTEAILCAEYGPEVPVPVARAETAVCEQPEETLEQKFARELGVRAESEAGGSGDQSDHTVHALTVADAADTVPFDRSDQQRRLAEAERALKRIGKFNPLALEEFAAAEQRHQYLADQLEDLSRTRQDLLRIIRGLDKQMTEIFASAFADTQAAFARIFPILFPGGSGELSLSNPEDLLNTGIEMTVRPVGKRVARMSLLSGGERSLAAVAWLIAIFTARPSPFYIMDEVEAALDDANLGRLLSAFETLRHGSQLIVITHQKRTMEIADALYGVSMRQDGVSAVIGQKLDRSVGQSITTE